MNVLNYITNNALILIPVLYILGKIISGTEKIPNRYIPLILLVCGVAGAIGLMGFNTDAVIQGILVTGTTVYTDQVCKQCIRKN